MIDLSVMKNEEIAERIFLSDKQWKEITKIVKKHYDLCQVSLSEVKLEVANLMRKDAKGSLDDASEMFAAQIEIVLQIKEITKLYSSEED